MAFISKDSYYQQINKFRIIDSLNLKDMPITLEELLEIGYNTIYAVSRGQTNMVEKDGKPAYGLFGLNPKFISEAISLNLCSPEFKNIIEDKSALIAIRNNLLIGLTILANLYKYFYKTFRTFGSEKAKRLAETYSLVAFVSGNIKDSIDKARKYGQNDVKAVSHLPKNVREGVRLAHSDESFKQELFKDESKSFMDAIKSIPTKLTTVSLTTLATILIILFILKKTEILDSLVSLVSPTSKLTRIISK